MFLIIAAQLWALIYQRPIGFDAPEVHATKKNITQTQKYTEKPFAQPIRTRVVKTKRRKSTACADTAIANESCNIDKPPPISVSVGRK